MADLSALASLTPADAVDIARDLTRDEALPPGFDLAEYVEEFGGTLRFAARAAGLKVEPDGRFALLVGGPATVAARELAAELFGVFLFLGVTGGLAGANAGKPVVLTWARRSAGLQKLAGAFARELLVPGAGLTNLVAFYGFGTRPGPRDTVGPIKGWERRDLDFLANLFEVTPACMEIRLVEEGLLQPAAV